MTEKEFLERTPEDREIILDSMADDHSISFGYRLEEESEILKKYRPNWIQIRWDKLRALGLDS
jgi:hypothetical protein